MKLTCKFIAVFVFLISNASFAQNHFEVELNSGYNNNVFLESDDLVINQSSDSSNNQDIQTQLNLMADVELLDGNNSDFKIIANYFYESLMENDVSTRMLGISLPFNYYAGDYRISSTLSNQTITLSSLDVLQYSGVKVGWTKKIADNRLAFFYSYTDKAPKDVSYVDYEGDSQYLNLSYRLKILMAKMTFQTQLFSNQYVGEGLSNEGGYVKAQYRLRKNKMATSLMAKLKHTEYEIDVFDTRARMDQQLSLNYNQEYLLTPSVQVYFDSNYIVNKSNVDYINESYNYSQWTNSLGARFSF